MSKQKNSRGIHILRDSVARKIAAGEVIDRPFSVVRELIDNSLDAESSKISLSLENGGISRIRVVDNGCGMSREDLELCFLPHATSKILNVEDIYNIDTLGFRGEALSAISTCSHLEIISAREQADYGHQLLVHGGKLISLDEYKSKKGTIVDVSSLFYNMPGRKKFLKSPSGESYMCKSAFLDKALPFPNVSFTFTINGKMKLMFPSTTLLNRVVSVFTGLAPAHAFEVLSESRGDFSVDIVAARPEVHRKDRKYILTFINKRRIFEYACLQAVEYGYSGFMPGKDHPVACVFITINPELVDFNIHPAKKECKIRILPHIHQCIVSMIKSFVSGFSITSEKPFTPYDQQAKQAIFENFQQKSDSVKEKSHNYGSFPSNKNLKSYNKDAADTEKASGSTDEHPHYLGQVFGLFLIAQYKDTLYIIDQHAAHERILFEDIKNKEPAMQELLFPVAFDVTDEEEEQLQKRLPFLLQQGIQLEKTGKGCYELIALPTHFHSIDSNEIVRFLKNMGNSVDELEHQLFSMAACRNAVKDGDIIDRLTAQELLHKTFLLENARCPHGRPVWYEITKEQLFKLLGRK